jgi:sugar lactone lactonase YvrE
MTRELITACALLASLGAATAVDAVETRFWHVDTRADFEEAETEGVSIDADGVVRLAPERRSLVASDEIYLWELTRRDDGWVVGTGDAGKVFAISSSGETLLADLDILEVMAVATARDGRTVYAGGAPGGEVFAISADGTVETLADTEQGVVWDIAVGQGGELYVVTGEAGHLYRIEPDGVTTRLYESTDAHLMCVEVMDDGDLIVGSAGDGLVCRLESDGSDLRVLYDADEEEVRGLVVAPDGTIYAALNVAPSGNGESNARPAVYRIGAYGHATRIWRTASALIFGFAIDRDGSLLVGTSDEAALHRIDPVARRSMRIAELDETSVLDIVAHDDEIVVTTGDPANAYALTTEHGKRGTVESPPRDAGAEATWSRIRWDGEAPRGSSVAFETRSGNRGTPDETWSEWIAAEPSGESFLVASPPARFLQWRLVLEGGGGATPQVARVVTSYREINLPPEMIALDVSRKDAELFAGSEGRTRSVRQKLPGGVEVDFTLPIDSGMDGPLAPGEVRWAVGLRTISWIGTDPNGDELTYTIEYRPIESERWLLVAEEQQDVVYTWDTATVPDGRYKIRVTASDEPGNPDGDALEDTRISHTFEIDNTPPEVREMRASLREDDRVEVRARASDARSAIVRAEVTIDGQEWVPAKPARGLLDASTVELTVSLPSRSRVKGDPVVLRVTDEAGNQATSRVFIE